MRREIRPSVIIFIALLVLPACGPNGGLLDDDSVLAVVLSGQFTAEPPPGGSASGSSPAVPAPLGTDKATSFISGSVAGRGDYRLFELGGFDAGDQLMIEDAQLISGHSLFTVVVFDQDMNLLDRTPSFPARELVHIMRRSSKSVVVGVRPTYDDSGGDFNIRITRQTGQSIPSAMRQVVYLNFGPGSAIRVHTRTGIKFSSFNAARISDDYAGMTEAVKASIIETMRQDYDGYDVRIMTSDEGPPPSGAYSIIHFGGNVSGLLGLADNVDRYNNDPSQTAVVFIDGFAPFEVMQLTPEEMGIMIGNVGSHELGHLLGLYHTRDPNDLMDTTGTAWELAENQRFDRAALEASVFPVGLENSPMLLSDTVGQVDGGPSAKSLADSVKRDVRMLLRDLTEIELLSRCGLCNAPGL